MSDWRKKQGAATFRGVPFFVDVGERGGGRRAVVHEYPFSEDPPFTEDLGKKTHTFAVEGYVIGTEYITARDALLTELERPGSGELVHPYFGTRRVVVTSYRSRESRDAGGLAQFQIEFTETSVGAVQPVAKVAGVDAVTSSVATAKSSVQSAFLAAYSTFVSARESLTTQLRHVTLMVSNAVGKVNAEAQALASLKATITNLTANVNGIANLPSDLFSAVDGVMEAFAAALITASVPNPSAVLCGFYGFSPGDAPTGSAPSQATELASFDALHRLVQRLVVLKAAELIVDQVFDSYDAAVAGRLAVTDLLDDQMEVTTDDTYPALVQLRADLVLSVPGESSDLPRLQRHTPATTVPSLVLAHRLYGDLSLEADLIARNQTPNPGFIVGGVELEVLSRG